MWTNLNDVDASPFKKTYDVCVCGSGPAGMAVVQKLLQRGLKVALLEAGDLTPTQESQSVYEGDSIGPRTYYGVESCRLRYFGGTSNHWTGRCGTFDPLDFEQRDIWPMPGWPISYEEAYSHLDEALNFLDLPSGAVDRKKEPHWTSDSFVPSGFAWSKPTRVGEKFESDLRNNPNVDVFLNANVTDANLNGSGQTIEHLLVENYRGDQFRVRASQFVVAFGALENARFLLNVTNREASGLGNEHDMVGRCFMEHFGVTLGRFVPTNDTLATRSENLSLNPTAALAREKRLGNAVLAMTPSSTPVFYGRLAPVRRLHRNITCANDFLLERARSKNDIICAGDGQVTTIMEQVPNPLSRVTLSPQKKDQFGKQRLIVDWRVTEQDLKTVLGMAAELGKALASSNFARLRIANDVFEGAADLGFHCHQMGTTRMSDDPKRGVVDRNAKLHSVDNLYIGGSSVFSTGGGVNPTLTLVSLALRLGDHLATKLGR